MRTGTQPHASTLIDGLLDAMRLLPRPYQVALRRYYSDGEPDERICADLDLDVEDFRQLRQDLRALYRRLAQVCSEPVPRKSPRSFLKTRLWLRLIRI